MRRYWAIVVYVAVLIGAPWALSCYNRSQRALGKQEALVASLGAKGDSLEEDIDSLKSALLKKVPVVVKYVVKWETLPPLVPALQLPDAKPVPASQLASVIILGTATIRACTDALNTCQSIREHQDSLIRIRTLERDVYKRQIPTAWDRWIEWGIRAGMFYLGTRVK